MDVSIFVVIGIYFSKVRKMFFIINKGRWNLEICSKNDATKGSIFYLQLML